MRWLIAVLWLSATALGGATDDFLVAAKAKHGEFGERAARFLVDNMPPGDRDNLSLEFLSQNLDLALQAREEFPWAAKVPEEIFLNDVLPYAVFDESRDPWREELHQLGRELVQGANTASEAAQALNRQLFKRINVHYNTGRKRPNQSLKESQAIGMATCTGLSIILVEACRAVGIPARAVGTPMWTNNRGNHTWVEVWDGDWHFTGADEYDANGLDRGWFVGDAAKAKADVPRYAIYATSWKHEGLSFPMVWARRNQGVAGVNVTARYAAASASEAGPARLGVRLWDRRNGERLVATVRIMDREFHPLGTGETKAGTADLNDMPRFELKPGSQGWLRFTLGEETREMALEPVTGGDATIDALWPDLRKAAAVRAGLQAWLDQATEQRPKDSPVLQLPLSRDEAAQALSVLTADRMAQLQTARKDELTARVFTLGDKTMKWTETVFGDTPEGGHSLWISMHGGGNAPARVNDRQWQNQGRLYELEEGIYLAPRAPTDTWNLWHEAHIDPMFQHLIDTYVALRGVNPNRVYLLGYSAGGDGVWQLAPRMADRFAAAAMMAGHPNEASLLGLRNLPFALFVGGNDAAYNRNRVVAERAAQLDQLAQDDPGGYVHFFRSYEGLPHWMNGKDAEALPWMAGFERNPWPRKIVWQQDDVVHHRFYWLELPEDAVIGDRPRIVAQVEAQSIEVEGAVPASICLRLSDRLLDLDVPVTVRINGREAFRGRVPRRAAAIESSLTERADPTSAATAFLCLPGNP
ncbi:MAG: hypothetical protein H7A46_24200 [Verrucomicrobiales bacterium]|nr:hypothetical protein [Verrucomicrobiales bacterium]